MSIEMRLNNENGSTVIEKPFNETILNSNTASILSQASNIGCDLRLIEEFDASTGMEDVKWK